MNSNLIKTTSPEETKALADMLLTRLKRPRPILLFGELGSGKTTFVKGMAKALNIPERKIKSPTFTYVREINLPDSRKLYHMDLYRCDKKSSHEYLEIEDIEDWLVIEWPENLKKLPHPRTEVHFKITGEKSRTITIRSIIQ